MIATILRAYLAIGLAVAGVSYLVAYDSESAGPAEVAVRVALWPVLLACLILDAPALWREHATRLRVWRLLRRGRAEVERAARDEMRRRMRAAMRGAR